MKRIWILLTVIMALSLAIHAQETSSKDSWSGELTIGRGKLHIGFNIQSLPDGKQTCTMDVPAQGAKDIPVEIIKNDSDNLYLSVTALRATYKGQKKSSEIIVGQFTQNGMILPLNLIPGKIQLNRPQTPKTPYPYAIEEVTFKNEKEGAELSGTLTYPITYGFQPKETIPVILMVTGSGGQDRNEELFDHKPFLVIADFLAKRGIATLRYDDRGVGKSTGPIQSTTTLNNLADAEAGISYLRSLGKFGKIGVLGHSEGGTVAFMLGANKCVDFLISLAGGAASGKDILVGQNEATMQQQGVPPILVEQYAKALRILYKDRIEGKRIENHGLYIEDLCQKNELTLPDNFKANLAKCITFGGEWLTWFLGYNPAGAIGRITCPVMALNGRLDLQVLSKDNLPVIKDNLPPNDNHLIKEYDSLNHLFQHCTLATALNYGGIEETFSVEVLQDMFDWVMSLN